MMYSLSDGTVVVSKGPMVLSILACKGKNPNLTLAQLGAKKALSLLEDLAKFRAVVTQNILKVESNDYYPSVVNKMIHSVKEVSDQTMTPLVCVAGTVADEVADCIFEHQEISKVIVNNGGDVAIRLRDQESAKVGIRTDSKEDGFCPYIVTIDAKSDIRGFATSGLGGRSFTKGIANSVTVLGWNASVADVVATSLANATIVDDPAIERQLAESIYPDTDISGHWVTMNVGDISRSKIEEALNKGLTEAKKLIDRQLIIGALINVKGIMRMTENVSAIVEELKSPIRNIMRIPV
jgi:ApbE superfamily uncharacterized protein (UPF0280 family)